jgi:hypothetical protein
MKTRVFLLVFAGMCTILVLSAIVLLVQGLAVRSVDLGPLAESLSKEDSRVLSWIIANVPPERIDGMNIPESWAEIFLVDPVELTLVSSTNPRHRGLPLYSHPLLLDHAKVVLNAIRTGRTSIQDTPAYRVIAAPVKDGRFIVALKPKAWERGLVSEQSRRIADATAHTFYLAALFFCLGIILSLAAAYVVALKVTGQTRRAMDALEALSLGDLEAEAEGLSGGGDMKTFTESFIRLKTSLQMATDMLSRR